MRWGIVDVVGKQSGLSCAVLVVAPLPSSEVPILPHQWFNYLLFREWGNNSETGRVAEGKFRYWMACFDLTEKPFTVVKTNSCRGCDMSAYSHQAICSQSTIRSPFLLMVIDCAFELLLSILRTYNKILIFRLFTYFLSRHSEY